MRLLIALLALLLPSVAWAYPVPHAELPSDEQPVRRTPTTGYTLALIWQPESCHARAGGQPRHEECNDPSIRRRFTLHGLWPDGDGANRWPQYCKPAAILTDQQIGAGIDATPAPQLLQHEWAKHGTCMAADPAAYFGEEARLFRTIRYPNMEGLARQRGLTAMAFQRAFADANPGMTATMLRLNVNKRGWLEEVWICLGKDRRPRNCPAFAGGANPGQRIRVEAP